MLIPLGFLAGSGGGVETDYELIETKLVASATSEISFTSLGTFSSTYKHLQLRMAVRSTRAAADDQITLRLNTDTSGNYAWHRILGNGSNVSSTGASSTSTPQLGAIPGSSATANMFAGLVLDILDPYSTTKNKTIRSLNGFAGSWIALHSILHMSTSSITSIQMFSNSGNIEVGSRFSLYGIKG
jgi:hypothetical protein